MPRYRLNLHDGPTTQAVTENVELNHDGDALDLAQISLLVTPTYTHAEVYRDDDLIGAVERDSYASMRVKIMPSAQLNR